MPPGLRIAFVENGGDWVAPFLHHLGDTYSKMPQAFDEDPVEVLHVGSNLARDIAPAKHRLAMTRLASWDNETFEVDDCDALRRIYCFQIQ